MISDYLRNRITKTIEKYGIVLSEFFDTNFKNYLINKIRQKQQKQKIYQIQSIKQIRNQLLNGTLSILKLVNIWRKVFQSRMIQLHVAIILFRYLNIIPKFLILSKDNCQRLIKEYEQINKLKT
ncbi:unnamed protein product [Paramecium sonneborni]|uniref:Transmembrane protein n=1 Tax=Paramecium sonneborni TaxID=65129 RepID=A0A8S1RWX9_9CILI|nr:unnamed protein product [Paramecium sonneborni]